MDALQIIEMRCAEMRYPATGTEKQKLADRYPGVRAQVDALYALPAVKYEEPAVYFRANAY